MSALTLSLATLVAFLCGCATVILIANFRAGEKQIRRLPQPPYAVGAKQFPRELSELLGAPVLAGNQVETLINGDEIFSAMLADIARAEHTITFETFIYWSGEIGEAFAQALSERARQGVEVHVMMDWIGSSRADETQLAHMSRAGVHVRRFHKPRLRHLGRFNNRTHRKVLVIDGRIGFTGGVGIADQWQGNAEDAEHWRDTHFRVQGPVVAQMQTVFINNWIKATGGALLGPAYFPALTRCGPLSAQMFKTSPSGGSENMQLMYLLAMNAARSRIDLASSYFVPDELATEALLAATRRGVSIRIIVPGGKIDKAVVRRASRARWGCLLEAGIRIFEYQPTMFHCKVMIVDETLVSVGSTNFDNRSLKLNDEANLNVFDAGFAATQIACFENDLTRTRAITLHDWQQRPWREKLVERTASLFGSQL